MKFFLDLRQTDRASPHDTAPCTEGIEICKIVPFGCRNLAGLFLYRCVFLAFPSRGINHRQSHSLFLLLYTYPSSMLVPAARLFLSHANLNAVRRALDRRSRTRELGERKSAGRTREKFRELYT